MEHEPLSIVGTTNARRPFRRFGIRQPDRLHHLYVIGKTGTGKSTLLEALALQDMHAGRGVAVIDPHGDLAERLVRQLPEARRKEMIYLDASDMTQPYGYNPLRGVRADKIPLAVSGLLEACKKLWTDAWGVRMEHIFRHALFALIEYGKATLPDILKILTSPVFRAQVLKRVKNEQVRLFWLSEFPHYNPRYRQETIAPIQNKVGALLADPRLYRIFAEPRVDLRFRTIMDEGQILIVNLSQGRLGEDSANMLGAVLVTTLGLAALSRADSSGRSNFFLYIDEFQSFTTLSVANMISELRKYGVGLTLGHQHLYQLEDDVRHAVLGNVGSIISFRLGVEDARIIEREFEPAFGHTDLVNLANYDVYVKLMIDGMPSFPFSATTIPLQPCVSPQSTTGSAARRKPVG